MAHADYECCVVCDDKQSYSTDAATKGILCSSCAVELAANGVVCHNVAEFTSWLETHDNDTVLPILRKIGYRECYYRGYTDELLIERGVTFTKERYIAA